MAVGEYVSVSTQRDTERALLAKERRELHETPDEELAELTEIYLAKGLSADVARQVAEQLTAHDALGAHAEAELGINPDELSSPWHAAFASLVAFTVGALLPLLAIALPPPGGRVLVTVVAVVLALVFTGVVSRPARSCAVAATRWCATWPAGCWPWGSPTASGAWSASPGDPLPLTRSGCPALP